MRSIWQKISLALFSFVVVYTFVWSVLEPIPIFKNDEWLRWFLILGISIIVVAYSQLKQGLMNYIFFRYVKPFFIKELQIFTSRLHGDSIGEGWKSVHDSNQSMHPISAEDVLFDRVYEFRDDITHDAIHGINARAKERGKKLDYFIKPLSDSEPVIYVRIEIKNKQDSTIKKKWLTLVIDKIHEAQTNEYSESEEIISVGSKAVYSQWMFFSEDIYNLYNGIQRWAEHYNFYKIDAIKVRGHFQMSQIIIYP